MMEQLQDKWWARSARAEARLAETFRFENNEPAIIVMDVNYSTFGDTPAAIPDDYYTEPAAAYRYQVEKLHRHFAQIPDDDYIPFLHPWFGTGVLASAFGIPLIYNPKADPAVAIASMEHSGLIDELPTPVPGQSGEMGKVIRTMDYFLAHCDLPVGFTDCQGPLATALQIIGYDKFCYWMEDCPAQVHKLMQKITDALIAWVKFQKQRAGLPLTGASYPLGLKLPEGCGGVWMSDDDSVMMSAALYREFVQPYNEQVLTAFGGGCIHYCGNSTQNLENYATMRGLRAINNFCLDDFEAAGKARRALREKGIVYMVCDFTPADQRLESYFRELHCAMDGAEGLVVASWIAPAIALDKGKYQSIERDRDALACRVYELLQRFRQGRLTSGGNSNGALR